MNKQEILEQIISAFKKEYDPSGLQQNIKFPIPRNNKTYNITIQKDHNWFKASLIIESKYKTNPGDFDNVIFSGDNKFQENGNTLKIIRDIFKDLNRKKFFLTLLTGKPDLPATGKFDENFIDFVRDHNSEIKREISFTVLIENGKIDETDLLEKVEKYLIDCVDNFSLFWNTALELCDNEETKKVMADKCGISLNNGYGKTEPNSSSNQPLNTILYGPPGTGKTYNTIEKALQIIQPELKKTTEETEQAFRIRLTKEFKNLSLFDDKGDIKPKGRIAFVTFHQSFSYEDFVEGIKPKLDDDKENKTTEGDNSNNSISYEIKDGIFKLMCKQATDNRDDNFVLIVDEINRGNISQIFGELITLIEDSKRKKHKPDPNKPDESLEIILPYSKQPFSVPDNLYIIGTMNTADRSVEAIDTALRRRFSFEEMPPKPELLNINLEGINLQNVLTNINARLEYLKDRDHAIGHAFLINCKNLQDVANAFNQKIVPLLQEYFYNDYSQIQLVLGDGFVKEVPLDPFNGKNGYTEKKKYELIKDEKEFDIEKALKTLLSEKGN